MDEAELGFDKSERRITAIVGHFGSGKTEFAVNLAMKSIKSGGYKSTALIDLDIANPYFRSRERKAFLEKMGIQVLSNAFGYDINLDLPAISAGIKGPIQNPECRVIMDIGGDDSGARVLYQFRSELMKRDYDLFCVLNANRPETQTLQGAINHLTRIEESLEMKITGIVNNTHLLDETSIGDILKGAALSKAVAQKLDIPMKYHCCLINLERELKDRLLIDGGPETMHRIFTMERIMRSNF